ncbi:MAG TPA: DUF2103 domain-containing protein [Spirochaetia bacterium]|nr:DUF2103 domain-containing protein [Spirochaetia bacterium]
MHRAGGKFTRSHTTLIEAAAPLVDRAVELEEVSKVSLGMIKVIGKGLPNIKSSAINGGLKYVVRGNLGRQEIYIYTSDPEKTQRALSSIESAS